MTISDAAPHHLYIDVLGAPRQLGVEKAASFVIGPEVSPVEAMDQARAVVAPQLARFLQGLPDADWVRGDALAVLTELVDVTARYRAGVDLRGRVAFDGSHVTVTVSEMDRALPAPEDEPGLYLVHRAADDIGQYAGDDGGRVTWASIPART
ncbi:hypothetical protein EV284_6370 [Streptomyces sp. BK022]|uniref:hypothetical protein n=1 Tax=Streptomyces sp. BK022 TaxID=2512123 RepID=UPI001029BE45|nr:hypothetical protein [Streptomyces sp. BK022]RZU28204.1 hypothetical protein EV284_6370 [Streptomyces sp. BK022]